MPWFLVHVIWIALLATLACANFGCGSGDTVSGEVRFHRDVDLPDGATVTVTLDDTSLADASAIELGRDVIVDAARLPVRFRIEYDGDEIDGRNEYTLSARVEADGELLYVNDTVHPVLTGGSPRNSDVAVISVSPVDRCRQPLPVVLHSDPAAGPLDDDAILLVQLWDVSTPDEPLVVTEAQFDDLGSFPIEVELPHDGVEISRHRRYELQAEIRVDGQLRYHIINAQWRKTVLSHCPDGDSLTIVNSVFPASE